MPKEIIKTWDDARLKRERLDRIQNQMKLRGIGAMYLHDAINVRYVLNTLVPGGAVFIPMEGEATALVRGVSGGSLAVDELDAGVFHAWSERASAR